MPKIFVSHIHEDTLVAHHLVEFLRKKLEVGHDDIFLSSNQQIELGTDWMHAISESFARATVVIALFSDAASRRQWVHFEAGGAWFSRGKHLIPLCIGGIKPAELGKPYANIQGADLHDRATAQYLVNTITRALRPGMRGMPPRQLGPEDKDVKRLMTGLAQWKDSVSREPAAV
jgi:TIR domain